MASNAHNQRILKFFLVVSTVVLTIFVYASYSTTSTSYGLASHARIMPASSSAEALRSHNNANESNDVKLAVASNVGGGGGIGIRAAPNDLNELPPPMSNHPKNVKTNRKAYASGGGGDGGGNEGGGVALKKHQQQQQKHHREPTIDEVAVADSGGGGGGGTGGGVMGNDINAASEDMLDEDRFINNDLLEEQYVQNIDNTLGNINNSNNAAAQPQDRNAQQQQRDQLPNTNNNNNNNINNKNINNNFNKIKDSDVLIPTSNLQKFIENADKILKNMTVINASPADANAVAANGAGTANQQKDKQQQAEDIPEAKLIDQGNNLEENSFDVNDEALPPSVVMTIKRPGAAVNTNNNEIIKKKPQEVKQKETPKQMQTQNALPKKVESSKDVPKSSTAKQVNTTTPRSPYDTSKGVLTEHIYESGHLNDEINIDKVCPKNGDDLKLLILITSAPSHEQARLSIRQTWGHYGTRRDVSIAFMLGRSLNQTLNDALSQENFMYGDLIRGQFIDSYNNLTLKTVSALEWVDQHCTSAKYVLKTDDDMFINVPNLLRFLDNHANAKHVIYGRLAKKWKPIRNKKSKYYVSTDQFAAPTFPPFTTGPAYVLSSDSVHELYVRSLNQVYLKLEDVFTTGIVAQQLGIKRVHVNEFLNRRIAFNPCNIRKTISVHMVKANEQFDLWKKVLDQTTKCK